MRAKMPNVVLMPEIVEVRVPLTLYNAVDSGRLTCCTMQ
jgi:hypothetical protein